MKNYLVKEISILGLSTVLLSLSIITAQAQPLENLVSQRAKEASERLFQGSTAPSVIKAGTANVAGDHYLEVEVKGEPLERLSVVCVTFHELSGIKVIDTETKAEIPHRVDYGFEEFTITFNEPVAIGTKVRTVIEGSTVRGLNTGLIVPYRVFAFSQMFGEIPIGTAVVRTPSSE